MWYFRFLYSHLCSRLWLPFWILLHPPHFTHRQIFGSETMTWTDTVRPHVWKGNKQTNMVIRGCTKQRAAWIRPAKTIWSSLWPGCMMGRRAPTSGPETVVQPNRYVGVLPWLTDITACWHLLWSASHFGSCNYFSVLICIRCVFDLPKQNKVSHSSEPSFHKDVTLTCRTPFPGDCLWENQRWSLKVQRPAAARCNPSLPGPPNENTLLLF